MCGCVRIDDEGHRLVRIVRRGGGSVATWRAQMGRPRMDAVFRAVTRPFIRTPAQGADTIVWLGSAPEATQTTGLLWQDRRIRPFTYRLAAGPDGEAVASMLWDYVAGLAAGTAG